jgi:DNA-binding SARP family transcriptional activator
VQELADAHRNGDAGGHGQAKAARSLLAAVPAPPPVTTQLAVLGPLTLRRDGSVEDDVVDPVLRRTKVQELVAYLVGHRRTTRNAVAAALWPDLDERSAGNNLSVTLNHLLSVLEPWREPGDPAFLLRAEGSSLQLVTGDHLRIDADDFDRHLGLAAAAESDGSMSEALNHYLQAVELYRDDLHVEVPQVDWLVLEREHYRTRFVSCAIRAAQLLLGRGRGDSVRADEVAQRVLAVDPWAEDAYAVLIGSALTRGDRSGAHRLLQRCQGALEDLGVAPAAPILALQRRLQAG